MKRPERSRQTGQALIEFILGMVFMFSFFFFYIKMAATFAIGNYIHYATFMGARAYTSSGATPDQQKERAEAVLNKMLKGRFKKAIQEVNGGIYVGDGPYAQEVQNYWNQGATYSFKAKLSLFPWSRNQQSVLMDLTSESWMPRSVSVQECEAVRNALKPVPGVKVEWDNGGC